MKKTLTFKSLIAILMGLAMIGTLQAQMPANVPKPIFKDSVLPQMPQNNGQSNQQDNTNNNGLAQQNRNQQEATTTQPAVRLPYANAQIEQLIKKYADGYGVPVEFVRRIVKKESGGNPRARHKGYYGLMQISPATAHAMGFRGKADELLDAEINLRFGVKYLRGAYLVANGQEKRATMFYQRGYYYDAKAKGLLEETGLRSGPKSPKTVY